MEGKIISSIGNKYAVSVRVGRLSFLLTTLVVFLLTTSGLYAEISGMKVTPSRALSVALGFLLCVRVVMSGRFRIGGRSGIVLFIWLALSLAIDMAHFGAPELLRYWLNLAVGIMWFYIVVNLSFDWRVLQRAVVWVALILGGLSLVVVVADASLLLPAKWGGLLLPYGEGLYRLTLFSWESNILGAIAAIGLLMVLPVFESKSRLAFPAIVLLLIPLVGAFSKGPWLAFAVGITVYVILTRARRAFALLLTFSASTIAVFSVLMVIHPHMLERSVIRANNIGVRWIQIERGFQDIALAPLFGHGTFSFGSLWPDLNFMFGSSKMGSAWIGQAPIGVLHDTGIVGLVLMLFFWGFLLYRAVHAVHVARRRQLPREFVLYISSLIAGAVALLVMDWVTTLYALPIYWAVMGLLACIPRWLACYFETSSGWPSERRVMERVHAYSR